MRIFESMKSKFYTVFIVLFVVLFSCKAQQNIAKCYEMAKEVQRFSFIESDYVPDDTLVDLKNGYYELSNEDQKLCQVTKFSKKDKSSLLLVTGYYSDMQCSSFPFHIFEIDKNGDSCVKAVPSFYFPNLRVEDFLKTDTSQKIAEKYLTSISEEYLSADASISQVLGEFYDFHFILPRYGTTVEVTLTVCDYIPVNQVAIVEWDAVENAIQSLYFKFNKRTGKLELMDKK